MSFPRALLRKMKTANTNKVFRIWYTMYLLWAHNYFNRYQIETSPLRAWVSRPLYSSLEEPEVAIFKSFSFEALRLGRLLAAAAPLLKSPAKLL